jgi:hypothetical protein
MIVRNSESGLNTFSKVAFFTTLMFALASCNLPQAQHGPSFAAAPPKSTPNTLSGTMHTTDSVALLPTPGAQVVAVNEQYTVAEIIPDKFDALRGDKYVDPAAIDVLRRLSEQHPFFSDVVDLMHTINTIPDEAGYIEHFAGWKASLEQKAQGIESETDRALFLDMLRGTVSEGARIYGLKGRQECLSAVQEMTLMLALQKMINGVPFNKAIVSFDTPQGTLGSAKDQLSPYKGVNTSSTGWNLSFRYRNDPSEVITENNPDLSEIMTVFYALPLDTGHTGMLYALSDQLFLSIDANANPRDPGKMEIKLVTLDDLLRKQLEGKIYNNAGGYSTHDGQKP